MRKKISLILVTVMTAAMLLTGCGDSKTSDTTAKKETTEEASKDKKKDDKKTEEKNTDSKSDNKTDKKDTEAEKEEKTEEKTEEDTEEQTEETTGDNTDTIYIDPANIYGGLWGQSAIVDGLDFLRDEFGLDNQKSISLDKTYYEGEEYWLIGYQDADDETSTINYVYVDADGCIYGGSQNYPSADGDNGVETYGGLSSVEAAETLKRYIGDDYNIVSSEQSYLRNQEKWYMGIVAADGSDSEVYYYYVDSNEIIPQTTDPW